MTTEYDIATPPAPAEEREQRPWGAMAMVAGILVVAGAALGALGGWLWYQWWGPPNSGPIYNTAEGPRWYDLTDQGLAHQFDGPAQYAVIALGLGLLLGVGGVLLGRRQPYAVLAGLIAGSGLAAYLAFAVGTALSPPDPQKYATEANVCTEEPCQEYDAAIEVSGWSPFLVWPLGALGGFCVATLVLNSFGTIREVQEEQRAAGTWLEAGGRQSARSDRSEPSPPQ